MEERPPGTLKPGQLASVGMEMLSPWQLEGVRSALWAPLTENVTAKGQQLGLAKPRWGQRRDRLQGGIDQALNSILCPCQQDKFLCLSEPESSQGIREPVSQH